MVTGGGIGIKALPIAVGFTALLVRAQPKSKPGSVRGWRRCVNHFASAPVQTGCPKPAVI